MTFCPRLDDPHYHELVDVLGNEELALDIWNQNEGNPIHLNREGKPSTVFEKLEELYGRYKAVDYKSRLYKDKFKEKFGDWVNDPENSGYMEDGEPAVLYYNPAESYVESDQFGQVIRLFRESGDNSSGVFITTNKIKKSDQSVEEFTPSESVHALDRGDYIDAFDPSQLFITQTIRSYSKSSTVVSHNEFNLPDSVRKKLDTLRNLLHASISYNPNIAEGTVVFERVDPIDKSIHFEINPIGLLDQENSFIRFAIEFLRSYSNNSEALVQRLEEVVKKDSPLYNRMLNEFDGEDMSNVLQAVVAEVLSTPRKHGKINKKDNILLVSELESNIITELQEVFSNLSDSMFRRLFREGMDYMSESKTKQDRHISESRYTKEVEDKPIKRLQERYKPIRNIFNKMQLLLDRTSAEDLQNRNILNLRDFVESYKHELEGLSKFLDNPDPKDGLNAHQKMAAEHILMFIEQSHNHLAQIKSEMVNLERALNDPASVSVDPAQVGNLKKFTDMYGEVTEYLEQIYQDPGLKFLKDDVDAMQKLHEIREWVTSIQAMYESLGRKHLAQVFTDRGDSKVIEARYREDLEREYYEKHEPMGIFEGLRKKKQSRERYRRMRKWVNKKIAEKGDEIRRETIDYYERELMEASKDISIWERWFLPAKNMSDSVIQMAAKMIDEAEVTTRQQYLQWEMQAHELFDEYKEYAREQGLDTGDNQQLYKPFLSVTDGEFNGQIVSEYHPSFWSELSKKMQEIDHAVDNMIHEQGKTSEEAHEYARKEKSKWFRQNMRPTKVHEEAMEKYTAAELREWRENNKSKRSVPKDKWIDPKWKELMDLPENHVVRRMYNFIMETKQKSDSYVPDNYALGFNLAQIRKDTIERIKENGLHDMRRSIAEQFKIVESDTAFGQDPLGPEHEANVKKNAEEAAKSEKNYRKIMEDERGREQQFIPIFFRNMLEKKEDLSYDLMTSLSVEYNNALNFHYKRKILDEMEMIRNLLETRDVNKKELQGGKWIDVVGAITGRKAKKTETSNAFHAIQSLMDHRLFGKNVVDKSFLFIPSKTWETYMGYVGSVMLSVNVLASVANVALGYSLTFAEAVGGKYIDTTNLNNALSKYFGAGNFSHTINDIGRRRQTGFINQIGRIFNATNDFRAGDRKFGDGTRLRQLASMSTLFGGNTMGEHTTHHVSMLAILDATKGMVKDGKYIKKIDESGNVLETTEDRSEALGVDELYVADKKGWYRPIKELHSVETKDGYVKKWDTKTISDISQRIANLNMELHGAYSEQNKAEFQRYMIGMMAVMFRKWAIPGFSKRFRGIASMNEPYKTHLETMEDFAEGEYVTTLRFLLQMGRELKEAKWNISRNWNRMTRMEKSNIRSTIIQVAIMMIMILISRALYRITDEGEEGYKRRAGLFWAYAANRLHSELSLYINPMETLRILKSPAASISMTERLYQLIFQIMSPREKYETGRRAGDFKLYYRLENTLPVMKQMRRLSEEGLDETNQYFRQGVGF